MAVVAVRQYQKPEDDIDILLRRVGAGLQIAQGIYGIKTAMERSDMNKLQMQREQEKARAEELKNKLAETGLLTQQQVVQSDIIPFRTEQDLAKAVGAKNWEEAQKKYPTLSANTFELNIATPKKTILDDTGEIIGVDEESRLLKKGPQIIRPKDLKDFDVNTFKASIKRSVLDKIMQGKTGGVRTLEEFQEKWLPVDDPEILRNLPSEIAALKEPVQVMVDGDVVTRMGVRRSSVRPITPTTPIQEMRLQQAELGLQKGLLGIEQAKTGIEAGRLKLEDMRNKAAIDEKIRREQELSNQRKKQGVFTFDEFLDKYIPIESKEDILNKYPDIAKNIPSNAFREVTIVDEATGERSTSFGVDKRVFDNALKLAKQSKPKNKDGNKDGNKELFVPEIGYALTKQDAKTLKSGKEEYMKLRRQLNEMISLREKYGSEVLDRSAVSRGKQLSNDILLSYKQTANLGVLSRSDKSMLNSIIPKNPLEFDVQGFLTGRDAVLNKMKAWRGDIKRNFESKIKTRIDYLVSDDAISSLEDYIDNTSNTSNTSKSDKNIKLNDYVKVSNGKDTFTIPKADLKAAQKDGYNIVK